MKSIFILLFFWVLKGFTQTYLDSTASIEERVQDLLGRMTLEEKIGQMTQADRQYLNSDNDIKKYFLGSLLSGGGSSPSVNEPASWAEMYDVFQSQALATRLAIPIIYGIDAVHGHNNVKGAVIFPHNIGMGCTWDTLLVKKAARITAQEVAGTGIDWTFGPCIAVPQDERWGRTYEGFGETAEITKMMSKAQVTGFQGDSPGTPGSIAACAKHFIADGATAGGDDQGNARIDEETLRAVHLPGYITAIENNVATVMASFSSWNGQKVHGSKFLLTDLLKTELGFKGFVVSDWAGIDQLPGDYPMQVKQSVNAGIDMVMVPDKYTTFISTFKNLADSGDISQERIDDAVARILRIKFRLGLFEHPFSSPGFTDSVGSSAHRAVAREAVRKSLVMLKKENGILPLSKSSGKILVAGSRADNIGAQCGGWTISWQGNLGDITPGTTILEGIQNAVDGAEVVYSADGSDINDAFAAVVVIGENPYAEGTGDKQDLTFSEQDIELVRRIKKSGIPTVVIVLSGRPIILDRILHYSDVLFAAWLPGTEGDGIADVLFGDYQPQGKLTHSWPRSMEQIPVNWGDTNYDPLFPYKFGLTSLQDIGSDVGPAFQSAMVYQQGKVIDIAFNKEMMAGESLAGFSVFINDSPVNITGVKLNEKDSFNLQIELESSVSSDDVLKLSYSPGNITAADGSLLQAFSNEDVANFRTEGWGEIPVPGKVEAESFTNMSGIEFENTLDDGGGLNATSIDKNDFLEYEIDVADSCLYRVSFRIASESKSGSIWVLNNGKLIAQVAVPVTGNAQNWETVASEFVLKAGIQKLDLHIDKGGFNLNWIAIDNPTAISSSSNSPVDFHLEQNYPNPFNPSTIISYSIGASLEAPLKVLLNIYNILGREVKTLVNKKQVCGTYSVAFNAEDLPSGTYIYKISTSNGYTQSRKMILLK